MHYVKCLQEESAEGGGPVGKLREVVGKVGEKVGFPRRQWGNLR